MTDSWEPGAAHQDAQRVEIAGRNLLVSRLILVGYEVARPERDRGIDLLVYGDRGPHSDFFARPIQLKAFSREGFSLREAYRVVPRLLLVYVWHTAAPADAEFYCLTYRDAIGVANDLGWTRTASWQQGHRYTTTRPSPRVKGALEPFRMISVRDWGRKIGTGL